MSIAQSLLPEFDHEMANTRRALERIAKDQLGFRPHERSMSLAGLATHIAHGAGWLASTMQADVLALDSFAPPPEVTSAAEAVAIFDRNVQEGRALLAAATDEAMLANWSITRGGATVFAMPRVGVVRSFVMNHLIHHRGQLTVYLRLTGVPVPDLYGPSADEGTF